MCREPFATIVEVTGRPRRADAVADADRDNNGDSSG
jgi:hypothetical protein